MTQPNQPSNAMALPPETMLWQMLFGALIQKTICVAAQLGIADLLAKRPKSVAELAAETKTHEPSLYRVLRTLASAGIFAETADKRFELTPMAALLRSHVPNSMRDYALMMGEDWLWKDWGELMHCVKTGGSAQQKVHGTESWEFLAQNAEAGRVFDRAMTSLSLAVVPDIVEAYDFSGFARLIEIAGGHGLLLAGILKANPQLRGVLFEQPSVMAGAEELFAREGMSSRVELVTGDFFQFVPAGADIYLMKHIIHDWDKEHCVKILSNIREAINENGKLLIVETVIPEGNVPSISKLKDLQMLTLVGGLERTKDGYQELLEASGFRMTRIIPTKSAFSVIEGEVA